MELQYCQKCISMTNHDEVSGKCLRCKSILNKDEPKPETVHGRSRYRLLSACYKLFKILVGKRKKYIDKFYMDLFIPDKYELQPVWHIEKFGCDIYKYKMNAPFEISRATSGRYKWILSICKYEIRRIKAYNGR